MKLTVVRELGNEFSGFFAFPPNLTTLGLPGSDGVQWTVRLTNAVNIQSMRDSKNSNEFRGAMLPWKAKPSQLLSGISSPHGVVKVLTNSHDRLTQVLAKSAPNCRAL